MAKFTNSWIITLCITLVSMSVYAQPANDDCLGAQTVLDNGGCVGGTTVAANDNWTNTVGCQTGAPAAVHEDVWYSFTATNSSLSIDVTAGAGWAGNLEVSVWLPDASGCAGFFTEVASNCGPSPVNVSTTGLTPGQVYYITVSNEASGTPGAFTICTQTTAPPVNCTDNDDCSTAATIVLPASGSPGTTTCLTDCNTGASPGIDGVGNNCYDSPNPTVWYTFTTDAGAATIDISLTSLALSDPEFTIWTNCPANTYIGASCTEGTGGSAVLNGLPISPSTTYYIAVSDVTGDQGNFDLCINQNLDQSLCNTGGSFTEVTSSDALTPVGGPYSPGEVVSFCYTIDPWQKEGCNWLQGIVPTFGDCWDPASFNAAGMPITSTPPAVAGNESGTWAWYANGVVTYNNIVGSLPPFTPVGAGWFFQCNSCGVSSPNPNNSWGDGGAAGAPQNDCDINGNGYTWTVCFDLIAGPAANCTNGTTDCTIEMKTYADGEIGGWTDIGCVGDQPDVQPAAFLCCPIFTPMNDTIVCDTYTFPTITGALLTGSENYYTGPGGTGTQYSAGNIVNFATFPSYPQTIYIYDPTSCATEISFQLTINQTPIIANVPPLAACDSVQLPILNIINPGGNQGFFTIVGGVPVQFNEGDWTTISGIYVAYDSVSASPTCYGFTQFTVTVTPTPIVDTPNDTTNCDSYTLPALGVGNYYSSPGGVGPIAAGTSITSTQTIYIYAETGTTPNCFDEHSFVVTIVPTPIADAPIDVTACDSYVLPALTVGDYYSSPGGVGPIAVGATITSTQTIYVYEQTGTTPNCFDENSFVVTIVPTPVADAPSDVTACDSYVLPALGVGNYFSSPGGVGPIAVGATISSTQTIYVYAETGTTPNCFDQNSFVVTIVPTPVADAPSDVTACDSYVLPALGVGNYFSSPGGVGPIAVGATISATQTIYVYAESGTTPNCIDQNSFVVTIVPTPVADAPSDVTACDSYVLPALTVGNYFSSPGGVGPIAVGATISTTQTIYVYAETGTTPNCFDQNSFVVTIVPTPVADAPSDVTACDSYVLPALGVGNYFSSPGGVGPIAVGATISATQTIYVYAESGTTPNCIDQNSFVVTIVPTPVADAPTDVTECDSYTLPALGVGNYFSSPGGVGPIAVGTAITSTQTIYVYAETGTTPNCTDENSFLVTINTTPVATDLNLSLCEDAPAGSGQVAGVDLTTYNGNINPGPGVNYTWYTDATATTLVANPLSETVTNGEVFYVVVDNGTPCTDTAMVSFTITATITLNNPAPQMCENPAGTGTFVGFDLTTLNSGVYIGSGSEVITWYESNMITPVATPNNVTVSSATTYWADVVDGNCSNGIMVTFTVNPYPIADAPSDVTACDSYVLPALTVGNYFSSPGGVGPIAVGATISSTQTIYVYAETGTIPNCTDENSFIVTINTTPVADAPTDVTACDSYVLPALGVGNYFSSPGGVGPIAVGATISSTQTIYVYAETGTTPNCTNENSFIVTINTTPVADAPTDVTACDSYVLPALGVGNYFSSPGGVGPIAVGATISSTQTIYVYAETGTTPNCTNENSFIVTINTTPVADAPTDVTACDSYVLPALGVGNYFSSPGGVGPIAVGATISSTQTIYVYAETGTVPNCTNENSFIVTINTTPVADAPTDVTACDSYVLPALTVGNYFSSPGGVGPIAVGATISSTQTIYVYAETGTVPNCTNENSFVVTIVPAPVADAPTDVTACDSYVLPALTVGNYFSSPGGVGPIAVGTTISSTQTIYVYAETGTVPNCTDENSFVVTIVPAPVADAPTDVTACDSYVLPALTVGNYFSSTGGVGPIAVGATISSTQTIYVYAETGTSPNCTDENSFVVTIVPSPIADAPTDVTACDSYVLPALTVGNYFSSPGGVGPIAVGATISSTQTIYVYAETGTVPNCTDENSFVVTIVALPEVTGISGEGTYCQGDVVGDIIVDVTGMANWTIDYTLDGTAQTATGSASPISLGNTPGVYVITGITDANCTNTATGTQTIVVNPAPGAPSAGTDAEYCSTAPFVDMTASGNGGTFTWYSDAGLTNQLGTGSTFTPINQTGVSTYYVTETLNGCTGPASMVMITINECGIVVPTAFTPGTDGINDTWEIVNLDQAFPKNKVFVYNRWGNLLFESPEGDYDNNRWDGTFNGQELPVGSYYFIIKLNHENEPDRTGTVSIIKNK